MKIEIGKTKLLLNELPKHSTAALYGVPRRIVNPNNFIFKENKNDR